MVKIMDPALSAPEALSPSDALREIVRVTRLNDALLRRTSGATWMVWGIVVPAIFLTYGLVGLLSVSNPALAAIFPFIWAPWVGLGILLTAFLWRTAGMQVPVSRPVARRQGILTALVFLLVILGGLTIVGALHLPFAQPAVALLGSGAALILVGGTGLNCVSRADRGIWVLGGAVLAGVALTVAAVLRGSLTEQYTWFTLIAPLATGLVCTLGGALVASREQPRS
ncbi:MAG: hypothetical protein L3K14_03835 [Thermoplasmata archaeon]|nr:hypothetical protein [Thermoplasmata archaeon]